MDSARIKRERKTISVMISMYCRSRHGGKRAGLCPECSAVEAYAAERIDSCPFLTDKPTCVKCPVHCYKPEKREQVRDIMRFSGPRMLASHPILTFFHVFDGLFAGKKSHGR
jgi:hypothetical protein